MTSAQQYILHRSLMTLDSQYDEKMQLISTIGGGETAEERHSTRSSAHYALGLLLRDEAGDVERACAIVNTVMDTQFDDPNEIYYGTFRTSPQAPLPPAGNYNWKSLGAGHAYFLNDTFDKIIAQWLKQEEYAATSEQERQEIRCKLTKVIGQVIPPVWNSYDPNWREFIGSTFAIILELFEHKLPKAIIDRIDEAMVRTVTGSIDRRLSDAVPMNTNIELMHLFITDYFGSRYNNEEWITHTKQTAALFLEEFREFGTFAEFNSTTYYGVDLSVLGMIRKYSKLEQIKSFGREIEDKLWRTIALYYHANLENMAGPFSRAYEMDMLEHSSMGVFLYLALGDDYKHLARENCESSHDPIIALVDAAIPEELLPMLKQFNENRLVVKQFRELCERHAPSDNRHLCTAATWMEPTIMLGALSGSQNTSGQLHPATIHWQNRHGEKYFLRLLRRETGGHWSTHLKGIVIDASIEEKVMYISIDLATDRNIEVFFQLQGPRIEHSVWEDGTWQLPGLSLQIEDHGLQSYIHSTENLLEQIYLYEYDKGAQTMSFKLTAHTI